jgi:ribokinase
VVVETDTNSDSFIGAYAVQYVKQKQQLGTFDIRKAIAYAHKAAARTIECLGAQESLPWMNEIEQK